MTAPRPPARSPDPGDVREYPARPIVGVGGVVVHEGRVLVTRRGREPNLGLWTVPGGAVRTGERLADAVAREVLEETGLAVVVGPVVEVLERIIRDGEGRARYHYVLVDFLCRLAPGAPCEVIAGDDCAEGRWLPASLEGLAVTPGTREVVDRAMAVAGGAPAAHVGDVLIG